MANATTSISALSPNDLLLIAAGAHPDYMAGIDRLAENGEPEDPFYAGIVCGAVWHRESEDLIGFIVFAVRNVNGEADMYEVDSFDEHDDAIEEYIERCRSHAHSLMHLAQRALSAHAAFSEAAVQAALDEDDDDECGCGDNHFAPIAVDFTVKSSIEERLDPEWVEALEALMESNPSTEVGSIGGGSCVDGTADNDYSVIGDFASVTNLFDLLASNVYDVHVWDDEVSA